MPTIDQSKLPIEITSKYSIVNNAFKLDKVVNAELDTYKNEPKDEINVEIGDSKQTEFYPQIKLMRWTNETNFSVRLKDTEYEKATITTDKDKIIWDKDNIKIEFFDYAEGEGGHKMIWFLKEKPLTNKVEFSLQSKGLDFFRQPPLTEEYQNGYSEEFQKEIVVTETQVKDLDGNVLAERPENVVGSYAVYHQTKGGMNDINGKEYKTGKAFHIYRPHIIDANGAETWGNLHIENGIYSVEIPQEFLDKAIYPIKSNDEFGYHSDGGAVLACSANTAHGSYLNPVASANGSVNSIFTRGYADTGKTTLRLKGFITNSSLEILANGVGGIVDPPEGAGSITWNESVYSSKPSVVKDSSYYVWVVKGVTFYYEQSYDTGSGTNSAYENDNNYTTPTNPSSVTTSTSKYSIYATYTPAVGGPANLKTYNTNAKANIKSIDTNLIANVKTLNTNA